MNYTLIAAFLISIMNFILHKNKMVMNKGIFVMENYCSAHNLLIPLNYSLLIYQMDVLSY